METKKNKNVDANRFRHGFFLVGLNYVAGITLAAFSFQQIIAEKDDSNAKNSVSISSYEEVEKEQDLKVELPKLPPQQAPQAALDLNDPIITIDNRNIEDTNNRVVLIDIEDPIVPIIPIVEPVEDFPDVEAVFNGGESAMQKWMQKNLQYPEIAMEMGEQGKVYLKFVVEKDGAISNVEVIKGVSRDLDNEAKRLVRAMPGWKPGESKGMKVRSSFTMPINFELN